MSNTGESLERQNGRRELDAGKKYGAPTKQEEETRTEEARNGPRK
jgi:hypothetical protein